MTIFGQTIPYQMGLGCPWGREWRSMP